MKSLTLAIMCLFLLTNCKNDPKSSNKTDNSVTSVNVEKPGAPAATNNSMVTVTPEFRAKAEKTVVPGFMLQGYWVYQHAEKVTRTFSENIYKGHWLQLKEKGYFTKGIYSNTSSYGRYTYDTTTKILELIPEEGVDKPQEWRLLTNGNDIIILNGTQKYPASTGEMIKITASNAIPAKQ